MTGHCEQQAANRMPLSRLGLRKHEHEVHVCLQPKVFLMAKKSSVPLFAVLKITVAGCYDDRMFGGVKA